MDKTIKDTNDLLNEILAEDPNYKLSENVINLHPLPNFDNIKPLYINEMLEETPPVIEYVFHPCLPVQGIGWVYAKTGLGKTLFTLNISYAIASGGRFLKYSCPKPRKVLYIDGEMAYNQLHSRVMAIHKQQGKLDFQENLAFLTPDKVFPFKIPMIDDPNGQEFYIKYMEHHEFDVLVLDNLSMLSSFDENKANEWKPIQNFLLHLRSMGKTIIIVHHSGKDPETYRGTSKMIDPADVAISLQPINDDNLEENYVPGQRFKIVYTKNRIFGGIDSLPYEVTFNKDQWTFQSIQQTELDKVVELCCLKMTQRDIAKDLKLSVGKVNMLIQKARRSGMLI